LRTEARIPGVSSGAGHYESFYVKATRPGGGQGIWIRHTVHKRPDSDPTASVWFTLFDADASGPRATKVTVDASELSVPTEAYIKVGESLLEAGRARGAAATESLEASWELSFDSDAPTFHHLPYSWLYGAPLPKTKFLSPYPNARFDGSVTVAGETIEAHGWPGMIGHNWGAEHAERWVWIQGCDFRESEGAYFDAALGRIKVAGLTTPWVGNGMLRLDGVEHRLGGFDRIRSTKVDDEPTECEFELAGRGVKVTGRVASEPRNFVAWVYADPAGPEHNTLNCSISDLELTVEAKGSQPRRLGCVGAAAYEIGMRETDHGIPLQPYPDG
jgi:hypothetical protein